jgi:hypothetical protein
MARLLDALDRARSNPENNTHLALQLSRLFESVENEEELSEDINIQLEEMEGDYLLSEIVAHITNWYHDSDFQSALDCLNELETAITDAEGRDWDNVAAEYHHRRIKLRADLRGHEANNEIEDATRFLETQHETISSNHIIPIIEITIDNIEDVSNDVRGQWEALINDLATRSNSEGRFDQERTYLRSLRDLQLACAQSTTAVEEDLVDSYRDEADSIGQRSAMQKADTLESGVAACGQYMSEARRTQWKREALQARRTGIETEMAEISVDDLPGVDRDALAQEMRRNTETIVDWFTTVEETFESATYALYCLLLSQSVVPDPNRMRLNSEQFVMSQLFQRQVISPEAYTFSGDPADVESIPDNYGHEAIASMNSLGNALYQLIKEGNITLDDIFQLIWSSDSLSPSTEAYLTDGLIELFDDNHPAALFILVPHLEATIVDTLESAGRPPHTVLPTKTRQQLLGGLFREATSLFGNHYAIYLRYRYTSREGMNLRNRLSHGQLQYQNSSYLSAVLTLYDILRCIVTINSATFLYQYGIPQRTLSPSSHFGSEPDLSLFTDLNKQIIGYGRSADNHSIVVLREEHHENRTELFVSRRVIHRWEIDGVDHDRSDLVDAVNDLRDDHTTIPEDIDWTWLDTDCLILHALQEAIDATLSTPADTVARDQLFTLAQERGIDESTARMCLRVLEDRGEIVTTDRRGREEILRSEDPFRIVEITLGIDGIGSERAWAIADHFDSLETFSIADSNELQAVKGIGPALADRLVSR